MKRRRELKIVCKSKPYVLARQMTVEDYQATDTAVTACAAYLVLSGALSAEEWRPEWQPPGGEVPGLLNWLRENLGPDQAGPLDLYMALRWLERMGLADRQTMPDTDARGDLWRLRPDGELRYLRGIVRIREEMHGKVEAALRFDERAIGTWRGHTSELKRLLREEELRLRARSMPLPAMPVPATAPELEEV